MSNCLCRDCKHYSDENFDCNKCMYEERPYADNTVIVYDLYEPKKQRSHFRVNGRNRKYGH